MSVSEYTGAGPPGGSGVGEGAGGAGAGEGVDTGRGEEAVDGIGMVIEDAGLALELSEADTDI